MRQPWVLPQGWGVSVIIGVAGAGQVSTAAPVTGRVWKGSAFGGARGRRCPRSLIGTWKARSSIDDLITHVMPLERINDALS